MAEEEEGPPPPNIVGEASVEVKAPLKMLWILMRDSVEFPRLYDDNVIQTQSLSRDRLTRKWVRRQTRLRDPRILMNHEVEITEPLEEDVPPPPPEPKPEGEGEGEGEEAPPADAAPAEEEAAGGEGEEVVKEEVPLPKRERCQISYPVQKMGRVPSEMEDARGEFFIQCTCPLKMPDEVSQDTQLCKFTAGVSIYWEPAAETPVVVDKWVKQMCGMLKMYAEKMLYLAPSLTVEAKYSHRIHHALLKKVRDFKFVDVKLSRSPSALDLLKDGSIKGSIGFYKERPMQSPVPIGLKRYKSMLL